MSRIASNASNARAMTDLARTFNEMSRLQSEITSGKRLQKPSDGPVDVATAMQGRATQRRMEQFAANATDAMGWLNVTDTALTSTQEQLAHAKVLITTASNAALGADERTAVANELDNVKSALLQLANTTYQGRNIFGGTAATGTSAYDASFSFAGDNGTVRRTIDDGLTVDINMAGPTVFGPTSGPAANVFQVLDSMANAVRAGDAAAMDTQAQALDASVKRVASAQIHVGGLSNQIEDALHRNGLMLDDVRDRLSTVEDADVAQTIIQLRSSEAAYQAALSVTAKVIRPSLVDFLR